MSLKKYIIIGIIIVAISSLIYMEIKDIKDVFNGKWSVERESQRQDMIRRGFNHDSIKYYFNRLC